MSDDHPEVRTNEDWGHPGRPRDVSCEAVQTALERIAEPVTATEVADVRDESYGPVKRRLEELHENGAVERKTVGGGTTIWW